MAHRPLPSAADAARILAERRTRPPRRPPPAAGRALTAYVKALESRFGQGVGGLTARWREIVGETIARRTQPVKLVKSRTGGAILEIKVDGPAAAFVQHQASDILSRVNLYLGQDAVARLRIVQGPLRPGGAVATPAAAAKARRRAPPLDAAAEAELEQGLAGAPDTPLRSSLLKLGRAVVRHSSDRARGQD